jgi:hypothetical protein
MFKKYTGGIMATIGAIGAIAGYISMALTAITFIGLFLTKLIGIFDGPWFALTQVSVIVTPMYLFIGGLFFMLLSGLIAAIGAHVYDKEKRKEKFEKYIDTEVHNEKEH